MKFALVDNQKVEAQKGLKGICPICQQPVIPKCGQFKMDHWAHKSIENCDKWWENETDWHRKWKNSFPEEWQEVVAFDEITGEKHIADIKTDKGMVIEFQHSHISNDERISRENFYKDMAWVVDGTRLKRDFSRFMESFSNRDIWQKDKNSFLWIIQNVMDYLPQEWINSRCPVILDFKGSFDFTIDSIFEGYERNHYYIEFINKLRREMLWCLLPIRWATFGVIVELRRDLFVNFVKKGGLDFKYAEIIQDVNNLVQRQYRKFAFFKCNALTFGTKQ